MARETGKGCEEDLLRVLIVFVEDAERGKFVIGWDVIAMSLLKDRKNITVIDSRIKNKGGQFCVCFYVHVHDPFARGRNGLTTRFYLSGCELDGPEN